MSESATPGEVIAIFADYGVAGLTGTLGVRVLDSLGGPVTARTTSGISAVAGTAIGGTAPLGLYKKTLTAPASLGDYLLVWDSGGSPPVYAYEDLVVELAGTAGTVTTGGTAVADIRSLAAGGGVAMAPAPQNFDELDDVDVAGAVNGQVATYQSGLWTATTPASAGTSSTPGGPAGGDLSGTYPAPTLATGAVTAGKLSSSAVTTAKIAAGAVTTAKLATGAVTNNELGAASVAASNLFGTAAERGLLLGKGGAISGTNTDGADFLVVVPYNMTLRRMKVALTTAPSGTVTVQLRRSTNSGSSYANVTAFVATILSGAHVGLVDPADVNVSEGDVLNFSVATGGGSNLVVEVVAVPR